MPLTDNLPDELLYTAFTYLDSVELGRMGRISHRYRVISSDSHLLQQHSRADGQFKEKIIYDMVTKDSNDMDDLDYLVGLSTPILRGNKISKMAWCLYVCVTRDTAWDAAWDVAYSVTGKAASQAAAVAWAQRPWEVAWEAAGIDAWVEKLSDPVLYWTPEDAYRVNEAAWCASRDAINNTALANYLNMWKGQDAITIGKKAFQISECLMLLSIDQGFCRKIQVHAKDLPECAIPKEKLYELRSNPWIKQYIELYH